MMNNVERPHFFPGQVIDYKDFNRLASQPDLLFSLLCRYLFSGGGVVVEALDEFKIEPLEDLKVRIGKGLALLPSGYPLMMKKELIFDLSPYNKQDCLVVVSLKSETQGSDKYSDPEDPAITGFKTELFLPEIVVSKNECPSSCIELFRVRVGPEIKDLRLSTRAEEWKSPNDNPNESITAVIDQRFRKNLVSQTYYPIKLESLIALREALYKIESAHKKIEEIFFVKDGFSTIHYLTQLHAELLSRPLQPLKLSYLASEFADKLANYMGFLEHKIGESRDDFDRENVLKIIESLEVLRVKEVLPRTHNIEAFIDIAAGLDKLLEHSSSKFNLSTTINAAITAIQEKLYPLNDTITMGGHVFDRIDYVTATDSKRVKTSETNAQIRNISAKFPSGEALAQRGLLVNSGNFTISFQVKHLDRPVLLLSRRYIRRVGSKYNIEVNGANIDINENLDTKLNNCWINQGILVPANLLIPQDNRLVIQVQESDLDFGFYEMAVYQPKVSTGAGE